MQKDLLDNLIDQLKEYRRISAILEKTANEPGFEVFLEGGDGGTIGHFDGLDDLIRDHIQRAQKGLAAIIKSRHGVDVLAPDAEPLLPMPWKPTTPTSVYPCHDDGCPCGACSGKDRHGVAPRIGAQRTNDGSGVLLCCSPKSTFLCADCPRHQPQPYTKDWIDRHEGTIPDKDNLAK